MTYLFILIILIGVHLPQNDDSIRDVLTEAGVHAEVKDEGVVIFLPEITFDLGAIVISPEAAFTIKTVVDVLRRNSISHKHAYFEGHTDQSGSDEDNMVLGLRRANSVKTAFEEEGLSSRRTTAVSYGESLPVSDNPSDNRRVEILLVDGLNDE